MVLVTQAMFLAAGLLTLLLWPALIAGIAAAVWGFVKSRKAAYLVLALYFVTATTGQIVAELAKRDPTYIALQEQFAEVAEEMRARAAEPPSDGDVVIAETEVRSYTVKTSPYLILLATLLFAYRDRPRGSAAAEIPHAAVAGQ